MIKKLILVLMIIIIAVVLITCGIDCLDKKAGEPPDDAVYSISTPSRIYYAKEVESRDGIYKLNGYWHMENDKWIYVEGTLDLNEDIFGWIKVDVKVKNE